MRPIWNRWILVPALAAFALLIFFTSGLQAQEVTAAINGIVTDPSSAAVAGAKVTARDLDRGVTTSTTTNGEGFYTFPRLSIGRYELRTENTGFKTALQSGIALQLNQVARVDVQLQVGDQVNTVEVTSAAPILQTESTQLGTVIDARTNTQLPLATRNYVQLTLLAPGSVHPNPSSFSNGQTTVNSGRPYINGNREQSNNFLLDGVDNNQASDNLVGYAPQQDAIQEFNLITQNASAEFGNFMGGIISTSIKAGTNEFHGDLFEFFRNDKLNANQWSNNFVGTPRPLLRWNVFGATLGGPVIKNKLFFFIDYQGTRFDTPASSSGYTVLTAAERNGDFSQLLSQGIIIRNPVPGGAPFVNNQIPITQLSPAALKIVNSQYYPKPINGNLVNNSTNSQSSQTNADQGDGRVDWALTDKDRIFGRYSQSYQAIPTINSQALTYNGFSNAPTHNGALDWTRTISPSLVNNARVGVNYVVIATGVSNTGLGNLNTAFGIPGVNSSILAAQSFSSNSFLANQPNSIGIGNADVAQNFADTTIQYEDTAIYTVGANTFKFGFQGFRQRIDTFYSGNNGLAGTFSYNGQFSGRGESDFLLGLPNEIGTGVSGGGWGQRANIFSGYFQDDWRVAHNLVLNLGIRYEIHTPWTEVHDRQTNFGLFSGAIEQPGQNGNSKALYNTYNGIANWQPRIGLAWTPGDGKTVIRAAVTTSTYLEGTGTNLRLTLNAPYGLEHDLQYTSLAYPGTTLDQGFNVFGGGSACTQTGLLAASAACFSGATLRLWDPNVRPALSNQWNFAIQRQLSNTLTLQAAYVGQKTTHLMVATPYKQKDLLANGTIVGSPYLAGNPTLYNEIGQISGTNSSGNQSYHALQVSAVKRLSNGLAFQANYTWSHCLTDSIGYYGAGGQAAPTSPYWQNLYDQKAEWGSCYYNSEHIFSGYVTYDLPFGRNRMYGKNMNRALDAVAGGWQVNAIPSFHSGFPLTITANDKSGTNSRGARASCSGPSDVLGYQNSTAALGGGYQWFSPAPYYQQTSGFGTCGVGTVNGPGLHTVDLSVSKLFTTFEKQNLEVRGEFINVSNTPILNAPNRGLGSNLGVINSSQGARNIQFGVKYNF